jgi:lipoprotein-anchoring transpeptidase ErfK/SrfK
MRRAFVLALLGSALSGPVLAQTSGPNAGGGGLIEMLFSGAAREPAVERPFQPMPQYRAYPPGYQPAPAPQVMYQPAPQAVYQPAPAQQPMYRPAPQAVYQPAPAQPQVMYQAAAAPQATYQPNYQVIPMPQVGYQPLPPPGYQQVVPMPQVGYEPLPPGYAPSSQGDMARAPVDPKYDRQVVDYKSDEKPGTVVIDTPHHFLFLVEDSGKALRYGIGVGRPGFTWEGVKTITAKKEWPDWYPPADMLQRRPDLPRYMAGGPDNPLGARAMYLGSTLYRIHGSNEPWTIGTDVSSGCIRLRNADVIDLYGRVQVGAKVVVM